MTKRLHTDPFFHRLVMETAICICLTMFLFHFYRTASTSSIWMHVLCSRLSIFLFCARFIICIFCLLGFDLRAKSYLQMDSYSFFILIPAFFCISDPDLGISQKLSVSVILFSLIFFKTFILYGYILSNRLKKPRTRFLTLLGVSLIWFYAAYASVFIKIHIPTGDEPHYLLMAHSMIHDGDLNLVDEYENQEYRAFYPDELKPKPSDIVKPEMIRSVGLGPMFSVVLIPAYLLAGYPGVIAFSVIVSALLILQTYLFYSDFYGSTRGSLLTALCLSVISPILPYSSMVYPDLLASMIIVFSVYKLNAPFKANKENQIIFLLLSLSAALLLIKFRFLPIVILIMMAALMKSHHRAAKVFKIVIATLSVILSYFLFDRYVLSGDLFFRRFGGMHLIKYYLPNWSSLSVIPGYFLDSESGILWSSPFLLIALAGIWSFNRSKTPVYWVCLLAFPLTILSLLGHFAWHAMPTPPLRYLLPVVPLIAFFIAHIFNSHRRFPSFLKETILTTMTYSTFLAFLNSIKPEWLHNLADGTAFMFEDLSSVIRSPVISILPSFTRPSFLISVWIILFLCFIWLLLKYDRMTIRKPYSHSPFFIPMLLMGASLLFIAPLFAPQIIETEDKQISLPKGGGFFPAMKDPFFHRERDYGWRLAAGDALNPSMPLTEGDWRILIRARLIDDHLPVKAFIRIDDAVGSSFSIKGKDWRRYLLNLNVQSPFPECRIEVAESEENKIAIDYVRFFKPSKIKSKWNVFLSEAAEKLNLNGLALHFLSQGIMHHPGRILEMLRSKADPQYLIKIQRSDEFELNETLITQYLDLLKVSDFAVIHEHQALFDFSVEKVLPPDRVRSFVIVSSNDGYPVNRRLIKKLESKNPDNVEISCSSFVQKYLAHDIDGLANSIEAFLLTHKNGNMSLSRPDKIRGIAAGFLQILREIANYPPYQSRVSNRLAMTLSSALECYRTNQPQCAVDELLKLYNLDPSQFGQLIQNADRNFFQKIVSQAASIRTEDAVILTELCLKSGRSQEALVCAELALRQNPKSLPVRLTIARALFHNFKFEESWQQCLMATNVQFSDDFSRTMMNVIHIAEEHNSKSIGLQSRKSR